jgi:hypothetical protein
VPPYPFFGWNKSNIFPDPGIGVDENIISFNINNKNSGVNNEYSDVNDKYSGVNNKYSGLDYFSLFWIAAVPSLFLFN